MITITTPNFARPFGVALIDGLNVARARPNLGRLVHEDLLGCIESIERVGLQTYVILDDTELGRRLRYLLSASKYDRSWLCNPADPVFLEISSRVDNSIILSRDDFGEFQDQYALVLFDPERMYTFEPRGGVGAGRIIARTPTEKRVQQIMHNEELLNNFFKIIEILLAMGDLVAARKLCNDMETVARQYDKEFDSLKLLVRLGLMVVDSCDGRMPGIVERVRFSMRVKSVVKVMSFRHRPRTQAMILHLSPLMGYVGKEEQFPNSAPGHYLLGICGSLVEAIEGGDDDAPRMP